ncbi:MAG: hypothetical protein ACYDA1_00275 [Vulcanimicrobiaceae bacterium]
MYRRIIILAALLSLSACAHPTRQQAAVTPSPIAKPAVPSALPTVTATVHPVATKTAIPSPSPAPTVAPQVQPAQTPVPEILPPDAAPRILSHTISSTVVRPGDVVSGVVLTSSNVASVTASMVGQMIAVPKVGIGRFALAYRVPKLPGFIHGTFTLLITARNTAGASVSQGIPITLE